MPIIYLKKGPQSIKKISLKLNWLLMINLNDLKTCMKSQKKKDEILSLFLFRGI